MIIREYKTEACNQIIKLFYNTVHEINAKDYTEEQLNVWATDKIDAEKWNESLKKHYTLIAIQDGIIVGFGDMDETGYFDRLYVHKDYQGKGIASALCDMFEKNIEKFGKITVHASITAKKFFLKRGYKILRRQQVKREKIFLINYIMEKTI